MAQEEGSELSRENERRKEARRESKERREMVRYEVEKEDRRSGLERRRVIKAVSRNNKTENVDIDDEDIFEDEKGSALDVVIGKISSIFGR